MRSTKASASHYRVEGDGQPLVLQHGFTDSLETWYDTGYVNGLKRQYWLILIDARGHGASDKPHEPDVTGRAASPTSPPSWLISTSPERITSATRWRARSVLPWLDMPWSEPTP